VSYGRDVTVLWCSGVRFVARLLDRRPFDRDRRAATIVRHRVTGSELEFDRESDAQRFLRRHCCEPAAYAIAPAGAEDRSAA
jgi:hypothetical protein